MVAPANNDSADALTSRPNCRQLESLDNQPGTWQPAAIPSHGGRKIRNHPRLPRPGHSSIFQFSQIGGQQLQAMSGVAEEVPLHQYSGNRMGLLWVKSRAGEQAAGKRDQIWRQITHALQRGAPKASIVKRTSCGVTQSQNGFSINLKSMEQWWYSDSRFV